MKTEFFFGIHAVTTLLERYPERILDIWVQKTRDDVRIQPILQWASDNNRSIQWVDKQTLNQKANGQHQGVLARCRPAQVLTEMDLENKLNTLKSDAFILVLDGVTDPHNLGACLRCADAAGVHCVIAPKDKSAPLNATVSKVACGAAESMPYIQVTNLARTLLVLKGRGIWVIGTADQAAPSLYKRSWSGPIALVMGAEEKGLRRLTRTYCDELVHIPMQGEVSSLNVSVATGICLFEVQRQRLWS
jgi:23S rRNA (guanosine2251-2'-O)-methyltransferase